MSWLRVDDNFTRNKKIAALTDREFRVWVRVLCFCSSNEDPTVDRVTVNEVTGLDTKKVTRYFTLGLLDASGSSYEVHDWSKYIPKDMTSAERQARWRSRRNGEVTAETVTDPPEVTASTVTQPSTSRARPQARSRPVPSSEAKASSRKPDLLWDALGVALKTEPATSSERGRWNKALKELREADATPDDLKARAREFHRRYPDATLTATALASNWGALKPKSTGTPPCPDCGVGGGLHSAECPVVADLTKDEVEALAAGLKAHR